MTERRTRWASAEAREIAASLGLDDAEEAVRRHARALLEQGDPVSLPVRLASMFPPAGIRRVKVESMPMEGALRRAPSGEFDILVRDGRPPSRQRFSIAHELGHTLFYKFAPGSKAKQVAAGAHAPEEEERLCNKAAEELLMPKWVVEDLLERHGDDPLHCICALADACAVSTGAALIRVAQRWQSTGVLQLWENYRGWQLRLNQGTGKVHARLDTYEVESWKGAFIGEVATLPWQAVGWMYSPGRRHRRVARSAAMRVPGRPSCVLVSHMLAPGEAPVLKTELARARDARIRKAHAKQARSDCGQCAGEGWVVELQPGKRLGLHKLCACRFEDLPAARKA